MINEIQELFNRKEMKEVICSSKVDNCIDITIIRKEGIFNGTKVFMSKLRNNDVYFLKANGITSGCEKNSDNTLTISNEDGFFKTLKIMKNKEV